jgi:hypothetical protein
VEVFSLGSLVRAQAIGAGLSASYFASAAAAGHALVLDDLAIKIVLGLDNAAKEHPAVHAGTGALEAGVVRLYAVVIVAGLRYSVGVHRTSDPVGRASGSGDSCGAIFIS